MGRYELAQNSLTKKSKDYKEPWDELKDKLWYLNILQYEVKDREYVLELLKEVEDYNVI